MKQRSVGIAILLTIITCGIYGIYWLIMLNDETNYVSGHQQDGTSGGVVFLLTLVTCGIYGYYWCYKQGEKLNEAKMQRGIMVDSSASVLYLILSIFGLSIVSYALMQSELNKNASSTVINEKKIIKIFNGCDYFGRSRCFILFNCFVYRLCNSLCFSQNNGILLPRLRCYGNVDSYCKA